MSKKHRGPERSNPLNPAGWPLHEVDWFLEAIVSRVRDGQRPLPVTLFVGSFLITGDIVSDAEYFRAAREDYKVAMEGSGLTKADSPTADALTQQFETFAKLYLPTAISKEALAALRNEAQSVLRASAPHLTAEQEREALAKWEEAQLKRESVARDLSSGLTDGVVHLRNATIVEPSGSVLSGVWWRGRLAAVDGFILRRLAVPETEPPDVTAGDQWMPKLTPIRK
jgi:hypothetical protein